jgi:hypothetical protein
LHFTAGIGEERPGAPDCSPKLVRLDQVVGRERHKAAVADLHLAVELQEALVLPPLLRTETSAREHQDHRIAALQLRNGAARATVVRQLVVGEDCAGNNVGSHANFYAFTCSAVRSTSRAASVAA